VLNWKKKRKKEICVNLLAKHKITQPTNNKSTLLNMNELKEGFPINFEYSMKIIHNGNPFFRRPHSTFSENRKILSIKPNRPQNAQSLSEGYFNFIFRFTEETFNFYWVPK
jgi:hypothetical protein